MELNGPIRKRLIGSAAGALLLCAVTWALWSSPGKGKTAPGKPPVQQQAPFLQLPPAPAADGTEWGNNPFIADRSGSKGAVSRSGDAEEEISLQGVLWDPKAPTAIINNRVVGVGDPVGSWRVVEIQKGEVVLSDGINSRVLRPK